MTRSCGGSGVLDPYAAHKAHLMPPQQSGCVCTMLGDYRQITEEAAAMDSRSPPFATPFSHPSCTMEHTCMDVSATSRPYDPRCPTMSSLTIQLSTWPAGEYFQSTQILALIS